MTDPYRVLVVGAGYMGSQIARHAARHGCTVTVVDPDASALERLADRDGGLGLSTALEPVAGDIDVAIEAASEQLELKRRIFSELDRSAPPSALLVTNSSAIRIAAIEDVASHPERLLNMHFFPPVRSRPLVELMAGTRTSADALDQARTFARHIGMTPLMVERPSTGFLFNRVWRAIKRECLHTVAQGIGSYQDIDRAWMIIYGADEGPFGSMDTIGLDVVLEIERVYHRESGLDSDTPPQFLVDMVEQGRLGVKTGEGFYRYPDPEFRRPGFVSRPDGDAPARASRVGQQLVGTWRLVSFDRRDADGRLLGALYGEAPLGYLTYAADGHFHLNVMRGGREAFRAPVPEGGTEEERSLAFSTSLSYAGSWSALDEPPGVTHHVQVCSFPNWVGADLRRAVQVSDSSLVLTATAGLPAGEEIVVTWERAGEAA